MNSFPCLGLTYVNMARAASEPWPTLTKKPIDHVDARCPVLTRAARTLVNIPFA